MIVVVVVVVTGRPASAGHHAELLRERYTFRRVARQDPHVVIVFLEEPASLPSCCRTFCDEMPDRMVHHVAPMVRVAPPLCSW